MRLLFRTTRLAAAIAALLATAAFSAAAQAPGRLPRVLSVGIGGGGTVPVGDFANDVKTGWNGLAFFQYEPVSENPWAVRAEAQLSKAKYTDDLLADAGAVDGDNLNNKVLYVGLSGVYHLSKRASAVRPYLIGGLGLYQQTATLTDGSGVSVSDSEAGFGFNGGAGLRFGGAIGVFVETRFHQFSITPTGGEKSTAQFIPVSVGIHF